MFQFSNSSSPSVPLSPPHCSAGVSVKRGSSVGPTWMQMSFHYHPHTTRIFPLVNFIERWQTKLYTCPSPDIHFSSSSDIIFVGVISASIFEDLNESICACHYDGDSGGCQQDDGVVCHVQSMSRKARLLKLWGVAGSR